MARVGVSLSPSPEWQVITLRPEIRANATVVDAQTGKPIPFFSVKEYGQLELNSSNYWTPYNTFNSTDGIFDLTLGNFMNKDQKGWRIAVSAPGYMPQEQTVSIDVETPVGLHYTLERGEQINGVVTTPNNTLVANAEVTIITRTESRQPPVTVRDNALQPFYPVADKTTTAANGSFTFSPLNENALLLILTDDGYAIGHHAKGSNESLSLTLEP